MKLSFAIGLYDEDGDKYEDGIFLFLDQSGTILKFDELLDLDDFREQIENIKHEIITHYGHQLSNDDQAEFVD